MTVSTSTNNVVYRGNGATTEFAVPFKVLDEDHLSVTRRNYVTGVLDYTYVGTDFSYSGIGDDSGTLTLAGAALDDDYELVIERVVPYTQNLDIVNEGGFYPKTVEEQLDVMTMGIQQIASLAERGATVPVGEEGLVLPKALDRASKFFGFDAAGNFAALSGTGSDGALRDDIASALGALLVGTQLDAIGSVFRTLEDRLGDGISVKDFGAVCDGETDDSAALQLAINHCLSMNPPAILDIPGPTFLSASVNINRNVDDHADTTFLIRGTGPGAGFVADSSMTMFTSSITSTTAPVSEFVEFQSVNFNGTSVGNAAYVMSQKFLRVRFTSCHFFLIRCLNSTIYSQTWYFSNCTIRNWPGIFFRSAGAFDVSFAHNIIEAGTQLMLTTDSVRGAAGVRLIDNVIELLSAPVWQGSCLHGCVVAFNYLENNGAPAEFVFNANSLVGSTVTVIGNWSINPNGPLVYWGLQSDVFSAGNTCGSPNPGSGTTMHDGVGSVTNFVSVADAASTITNPALNQRIGGMRAKGVQADVPVTVTYGADMYPLATDGNRFVITANDGVDFIIRPPVNPVVGQRFTFTIRNTSGGALGAINWVGYKMATWTSPATGNSRSITFHYDGTNFVEIGRTSADVPN